MKFKRFFKSGAAALLIAVSVSCTAAFAGCAENNKSSGSGTVSYISVNSEVYSSAAEVVAAVADTVVEISTESVTSQWGMQYIVSGAGSGVIVGKEDDKYYIVTNNHVIDGAKNIVVRTREGTELSASLIAADDSADIAIVSVAYDGELKLAVWGNSDDLKIGEDLIAIGNPLGSLGGTVTKGILSATGRTINVGNFPMTLLQTDTAINPGNSGGGLFNMRGELIGVVNAKTSNEEIEGICFAIPANTAREVYSQLSEYGYIVGRATFNLTLAEGNLNSQAIVYVTEAEEGEAFKKYDRIAKIDGKEISSLLEYNAVLATLTPDDTVEVEVYRGSVTQTFFGNSISFDSSPTTFTVKVLQYGA